MLEFIFSLLLLGFILNYTYARISGGLYFVKLPVVVSYALFLSTSIIIAGGLSLGYISVMDKSLDIFSVMTLTISIHTILIVIIGALLFYRLIRKNIEYAIMKEFNEKDDVK